jgi:hypothetical protein
VTADPLDELWQHEEPVRARGLEWLLTDPLGFGITTATPVQRAACRIREGQPLGALAQHPDVINAFGGSDAIRALPSERGFRPIEVCEVASPRTAKTIRAVASAVLATQTVDVSRLGPGEVPRVSIVSLKLDVAHVPFKILLGAVKRSTLLAPLLLEHTKDTALFRHPTGREVEIACVAGAKAGAGLISRWSAGVIFDEAPRMHGQEDGIVNLDDARSAVLDRLLPGAQVQYVGSPWAPFGPVYAMVQEHHGKPSRELVVLRTTGPAGNPMHWTPEFCERLKRQDENAWRVGVLGEFVDAETALFTASEVERCTTLDGDVAHNALWSYCAVMDPATRGNAWTLVVLGNAGGGRVVVVKARQWVGSGGTPLSPRDTLSSIRDELAPYGLDTVHSDQWAADALIDLGRTVGLTVLTHTMTGPGNVDAFDSLATFVRDGRIDLPKGALVRDMLSVRKKVTQAGIRIEYPRTADGRHADYAAALALGMLRPIADPKKAPAEASEKDYATARKAELTRILARQQRRRSIVMPS